MGEKRRDDSRRETDLVKRARDLDWILSWIVALHAANFKSYVEVGPPWTKVDKRIDRLSRREDTFVEDTFLGTKGEGRRREEEAS